jgi:hypothetical protein
MTDDVVCLMVNRMGEKPNDAAKLIAMGSDEIKEMLNVN